MNRMRGKTTPQDWDDARDVPFFRITADLFPAAFCSGAGVLLASYDDELEAPVRAVAPRSSAARPVPVVAEGVLHRS
jgi:hypothetical protein